MAEACRALSVPVISGNVSLYNESDGTAIFPTPIIGMLGILEDVEKRVSAGFQHEGDAVFLLGNPASNDEAALAGSEYLSLVHAKIAGRPEISLDDEKHIQSVVLELAGAGVLHSAHDCSDGGLAVTLAESCLLGNVGLDASSQTASGRLDAALFGESASRIVVSCNADDAGTVEIAAARAGVACRRLGSVGGDRLIVGDRVSLDLAELREAYEHGLDKRH
jgi:phosphoribosylformylglycinamidine synthase